MAAIQTPEILLIMNNAISNIVYFVEYYGLIVFIILCMFFVTWLVWNLATFIYELLKNSSR